MHYFIIIAIIEKGLKPSPEVQSIMHYFIIIAIIAVIVIFQIKYFTDTWRKIKNLKTVFPKNGGYALDSSATGAPYIHYSYNAVFNTIVKSINDYLENNKGAVSDFHLLKDIVERNCDTCEEEIDMQIPAPLYLGLVGTMAGILVGIGYLWVSGGLSDLLNAGSGNSGANGVEALLGGVALAMISSIFGILFTTVGSMRAKTAKSEVESSKHIFLSWMQATLLPKLSDGVAATIEKLTQNLNSFNRTFSQNNYEFQSAISSVTGTYKDLSDVLQAINGLRINKIAQYNIEVYDKLKNCTDEIGLLGEYLKNTNAYLADVRALNENLDKNENRTRVMEDMGRFFKDEIKEIEQRKLEISRAVGKTDDTLRNAFAELQKNAEAQMSAFNVAAGKQQDALQSRLEETSKIYEELHNLTEIKKGIANFERATKEQNAKIDELVKSIEKLATTKSGVVISNSNSNSVPKWVKIAAASGFTVIVLSCAIMACSAVFENNNKGKTVQTEVPVKLPIEKIVEPVEKIVVPVDSCVDSINIADTARALSAVKHK